MALIYSAAVSKDELQFERVGAGVSHWGNRAISQGARGAYPGAYREFLKLPRYAARAKELFKLYPAATDAEAITAFKALGTDDSGYGAYHFARDIARAGQKTYLFYFKYPSKGMRGPAHGAELKFISSVFRKSSWGVPSDEDLTLAEVMTTYWTRFAALSSSHVLPRFERDRQARTRAEASARVFSRAACHRRIRRIRLSHRAIANLRKRQRFAQMVKLSPHPQWSNA